jgi:hypothetical protein
MEIFKATRLKKFVPLNTRSQKAQRVIYREKEWGIQGDPSNDHFFNRRIAVGVHRSQA